MSYCAIDLWRLTHQRKLARKNGPGGADAPEGPDQNQNLPLLLLLAQRISMVNPLTINVFEF